MTELSNKSDKRGRGRPSGLGPRTTCCVHGAYAKDLNEVYKFWKKHSHDFAAQVDMRSDSYARALGWDSAHPRFSELRDLAILTLSRNMLFVKIIEKDFSRVVRDPISGHAVKKRACDQFARVEKLDDEIQKRLKALGYYK